MKEQTYVPFKKPGTKTSYTKFEINELLKCSHDPKYFIVNYIRIQHPKFGALPFNLFNYQHRLIDDIHTFRNVCVLFPRQAGKTISVSAYLLWYALFNEDKTILIVANKLNQAMEIMDRIRYAYEELPNWLRDSATEYNKGSIKFSNGSRIICRATTADAGRGLSISLLYIDEFSFIRSTIQDAFWTAIQPTLSTGGRCIITSTPNNDEDIFAQVWRGANDNIDEFGNKTDIGSNGFRACRAYWNEHPDRDENWKKAEVAKIGQERFDREYGCEFISADNTLINPLVLSRLKSIDPKFTTGAIRWFKDIEPDKVYLVSLDPCSGVGRDFAAIQIFEMPTMIQVGEWMHNRTPPKGQVQLLLDILKFLNAKLNQSNPEIYWSFENNSVGEAILALILEIGEDRFPGNLINEPKVHHLVKKYRRGLVTTNRTKNLTCTKFKSLVDQDKMVLNSHGLIYQLKNYVASGQSFSGKVGINDDLVSATLNIIRIILIISEWGAFDSSIVKEDFDIEDLPSFYISII